VDYEKTYRYRPVVESEQIDTSLKFELSTEWDEGRIWSGSSNVLVENV
jgi:hypothetical protein